MTDELLAAFRRALAHEMPQGRKGQSNDAIAAAQALMLVARTAPWERPLTDPLAGGPLQAALLAKLDADELKAWERYASRCRKAQAAFEAEYAAATRRNEAKFKSPWHPENWASCSCPWAAKQFEQVSYKFTLCCEDHG